MFNKAERLIDFDFMVEEGMISQADRELVTVVETAEEIISLLEVFYANCSDRPFPGDPV